MKIKLPLTLLAYVFATLPSIANDAAAPADGENVSITESVRYVLSTDMEYGTTVFQADPSIPQEQFEVSFEGDGLQNLTLNKEDTTNKTAQFLFRSKNDDPRINEFTLSISRLNDLHLGGTYGAVELSNNQGNSVFSITDIGGNVCLDNNTMERSGNAADALVSLYSSGNNTILIDNVGGTLSISNNTKTSGAAQSGLGLLIYSSNKTENSSNSLIQITNVRGGIDVRDNTFSAGQGVISIFNDVKTGNATIIMDTIAGGVRFVNNDAGDNAFGACLTAGCKVNWGDELFSGHAAIQLSNIQGDILFQNNSSYAGSAIFVNGTESMLSISGVEGSVSFTGNHAGTFGGAIYFETGSVSENNVLSIQHVQGDVLFENNSATYFGGAICSSAPIEDEYGSPTGPADARIILLADGGDIIFQSNVMYAGGTDPIANAILADGKHKVELGAAAGRKIAFYDPIVMQDEQENASSLHFNKGEDCQGEILFSGRDYADSEDAANYTSTLTGDAFQYNGTVRLDQRAALELVNYVQEGGILAMGRRTSLAASGNVSLKTLTLDLSLSGEAASITAAGSVSADRLTVYASSSGFAAGDTVLTIKAASFGGILEETGDHRVAMRNDQGMNFLLEMNWDLNEEGSLVFTTGSVVEEGVIAELQGSNIANSMLSSASTLRSFTGTGLEHLDTARFLSPLKSNVWTSGLGDFQMQRTKGGIEGFDYQGGGFAVGGDYKLGEQWLGGVAYGYTSGKNISREYRATNRQNTNMGLIYTGWRLPMNKGQALTITAAAGFSSSDNRLSSVTSGGQNSSGSWTNRAWDGTVKVAWDLPVGKNLVLTPHIGVEYTDVVQEAFTESGEMARRFDRGHYRNLALPVGLSLTQGLTLGGMPWSHTVSVEYLPDVYRSNAGTYARLVSNGYGWGVDGSKPARQGVRAGISGRLQVTNNWSAYGSYQVEARDSFVNQRVMLGVGYSF